MNSETRLTFPIDEVPKYGILFNINEHINWVRMPLPMSLNHVNLWTLGGIDDLTLIDADDLLDATFNAEGYDGIVLLRDIEFHSTCEHHMLPFTGSAHVAYIPVEKIVGISKLARLVELHALRLQNQERITKSIADDLERVLQPLGCAVIIEAKHGCMQCRGVKKQNSVMTTSTMKGVFFDNSEARIELLQLINNKMN